MYIRISFIIILIISIIKFSCGQEFDKTFLTFDLSFNNPNSNSLHVTHVGVKSDLISGDFVCLSGSRSLVPLADFIVRFHIADEETIIDADSIIQIEPKGSVRFKISIIPNATGACGYWSTNISAIVLFDDGTKYLSKPELITSKEFKKYKKATQNLTNEELIVALQHRDVGLRQQSVRDLANSTIDKDTKILLLGAKLKDNNTYVRQAAAEVAGDLVLIELTSILIENLENTKEDNEISSYCDALGNLGDKSIKVTDLLIDQLLNLDYRYYFSATESLIKIDAPHVPERVLSKAKEYFNWTKKIEEGNDHNEKQRRYSDLMEILINYQYKESISYLQKIFNECQNELIVGNTIYDFTALTKDVKITKNPFILSFKDEFQYLTKHNSYRIRSRALDLVCKTTEDVKEIIPYLKNGINDENQFVRMSAADWIGELNLEILIPEIRQRVIVAQNKDEKAKYCEVLKKFNQKCE